MTAERLQPTKRWAKGDKLVSSTLNEQVDKVNRLVEVPSCRQIFTKGGGKIRRFEVVSVDDDYIVCIEPGDTSSDPKYYNIAKPYLLQRTPFDGETRDAISYAYTSATERTATDETYEEEDQVIVPNYVAGDIIYAAFAPTGGTGVEDASMWLDLNVDGRAWAKVDE